MCLRNYDEFTLYELSLNAFRGVENSDESITYDLTKRLKIEFKGKVASLRLKAYDPSCKFQGGD